MTVKKFEFEFEFKDEDGDILKVRYTHNSCSCSNKCYPDTLEVEDYPWTNYYLSIVIDCPEICYFLDDLLNGRTKQIQ